MRSHRLAISLIATLVVLGGCAVAGPDDDAGSTENAMIEVGGGSVPVRVDESLGDLTTGVAPHAWPAGASAVAYPVYVVGGDRVRFEVDPGRSGVTDLRVGLYRRSERDGSFALVRQGEPETSVFHPSGYPVVSLEIPTADSALSPVSDDVDVRIGRMYLVVSSPSLGAASARAGDAKLKEGGATCAASSECASSDCVVETVDTCQERCHEGGMSMGTQSCMLRCEDEASYERQAKCAPAGVTLTTKLRTISRLGSAPVNGQVCSTGDFCGAGATCVLESWRRADGNTTHRTTKVCAALCKTSGSCVGPTEPGSTYSCETFTKTGTFDGAMVRLGQVDACRVVSTAKPGR